MSHLEGRAGLSHPKGNQYKIFTGRTDVSFKGSILWKLDVKSQFVEKTLMLREIGGKRSRG